MSVVAADLNARTQNFFRDVNERIAAVNAGIGRTSDGHDWLIEVLCECGRQECTCRLLISEEDYELLRCNPIRFVLAAGHEDKRVEGVVRRTADYWVVANKGRAAMIARAGDPRERPWLPEG